MRAEQVATAQPVTSAASMRAASERVQQPGSAAATTPTPADSTAAVFSPWAAVHTATHSFHSKRKLPLQPPVLDRRS